MKIIKKVIPIRVAFMPMSKNKAFFFSFNKLSKTIKSTIVRRKIFAESVCLGKNLLQKSTPLLLLYYQPVHKSRHHNHSSSSRPPICCAASVCISRSHRHCAQSTCFVCNILSFCIKQFCKANLFIQNNGKLS